MLGYCTMLFRGTFPGATQRQVNELSKAVGLDLPPSIRASLLRHNGCVNKKHFLTFEFGSADEIARRTIQQRKWFKEHCEENETYDELGEGGWNHETIMMGWSGTGYDFAVECQTCEEAISNVYVKCSHTMKLTRDYVSYLEALVDHLKKRSFIEPKSDTITIHSFGEHTGFLD